MKTSYAALKAYGALTMMGEKLAAALAAVDIVAFLPRLKAVALDCLHAAAELAALALFLVGSGIWSGILRGVI